MSNVSKELLREYIKEQKFSNANDILNGLKDMFRDVFQEALEAEMDEALGYGKYSSIEKSNDNSRNGYSKKTVKTELGLLQVNIPRDRNSEFESKIVPKYFYQNLAGRKIYPALECNHTLCPFPKADLNLL